MLNLTYCNVTFLAHVNKFYKNDLGLFFHQNLTLKLIFLYKQQHRYESQNMVINYV